MDTVHAILQRLRIWFLVWFVAEALVGIAASAYVLDGMSRHWFWSYATGGVGAAGTVAAGLGVSLMLLLLAWALLEALLDLKPWARIVMLVIGWITVVSAALNVLSLPATWAHVEPFGIFTEADWPVLVAITLATKIADLAFWSWAIYVLQGNAAVRDAFVCSPAPHGQTPTLPLQH